MFGRLKDWRRVGTRAATDHHQPSSPQLTQAATVVLRLVRAPEIFVPNMSGTILPTRVLKAAAAASAMAMPVAADTSIDTGDMMSRIDRRPALSMPAPGPQITRQGDTFNISIVATPGMDERAIARAVRQELERIQDGRRGDLHDGVDY